MRIFLMSGHIGRYDCARENQFEINPSKENRQELKKAKAELTRYWLLKRIFGGKNLVWSGLTKGIEIQNFFTQWSRKEGRNLR